MAGKRARGAEDGEQTLSVTPKKLRFGPPEPNAKQATPTKSALKQSAVNKDSTVALSPAVTPSKRSSKKGYSFATPTKNQTPAKAATPTTGSRRADLSARKKATRAIIERVVAGDSSDDELNGQLANEIYDQGDDSEGEDQEEDVLQTTEAPTAGDEATGSATPSKRGRGRPKGSKNKRTPTPPPDLPPYEQYFFQNRPSAWKHTSNTPNNLKLLAHGEYYAAINQFQDPHASSIASLHEHHAGLFPKWAFELAEGFTVILYGYGSKRRLLTGFADYLYKNASSDAPPIIVIVNAHHPAFSSRVLLQTIAKAIGLDVDALPATVKASLEHIQAHLHAHAPIGHVYLLVSTLTARTLTTPAAISLLTALAVDEHISLLLTASNPSFPLLWPSNIRDALNPILHDATTFLPYDSGTGPLGPDAMPESSAGIVTLPIPPPPPGLSALGSSAPDAVAELLGRKTGGAATRERVRWVLRSLPANARGLYRMLIEDVLASADASTSFDDVDDAAADRGYDPYDADPDMNLDWLDGDDAPVTPRKGRGRPRKNAGPSHNNEAGAGGGGSLPGVSSKTLYTKAAAAFLCSSEMAFRGLLREFVDHAMVEIRRGDVGEGGEMLGIPIGRNEAEGVLDDLKTEF